MSYKLTQTGQRVQELLDQIANGGQSQVTDAVLYTPQDLGEEKRKQARKNIGAAAENQIPTGAVLYSQQQNLTGDQQAQARTNIGVPTKVSELENDVHYITENQVPIALPQKTGTIQSGVLPTSGWTSTIKNFIDARTLDKETYYDSPSSKDLVTIYQAGYTPYIRVTGWEVYLDGEWHKLTQVTPAKYAYNDYNVSYLEAGRSAIIRYEPSGVYAYYKIYEDGHVGAGTAYKDRDVQMPAFRNTETISGQSYTISDTSITANSDILMELTDEGGVKSYSMEADKITVIRDTVPTQPIPYTYKVKQTNASGQFTVLNHFVPSIPVMSVNGQTGAVTIAVPTKTSQLENDSGFITQADIPTTPTSLPVTYKKVSGELPTTGWSPLGWEQSTFPASRPWLGIAYGKGKFVTIANSGGKGAYSTDGINWTEMTMPSTGLWAGITYGNGKFVAVKTSSDKGAYSVDGINWTETTMPSSPAYRNWLGVAYGNGKFVAFTMDSSYCAYSNDGITWTATTLPATGNWRSIVYGNDKFVAVAKGTDKGAYSTDGITWTEMTLPASRNWQGITYGEGKFIAIAGSSDKGAYSTDGITWTEMTLPSSRDWFCTAYGNGKFVAIEYNGLRAAYSTDGITWLAMTTPIIRSWSGVVYGDNKFVVVSKGASVSSQNNKGLYWEVDSNKSTYIISDTFITTNTSVKMYLTDEGRVKALRMSNGSITVLRDTVPTTAIPYKYEVKQTSAPGFFEVINAYVPTVPSKTSDLTNDSGFLTKNNIVAGDNVTVTDENGNVKISATGGGSGGGGIGDWQTATFDTELEDGTYLIKPITSLLASYYNPVIISIEKGHSGLFIIQNVADADMGMVGQTYTAFDEKKIVQTIQGFVMVKGESNNVTLEAYTQAITENYTGYKYIKIK